MELKFQIMNWNRVTTSQFYLLILINLFKSLIHPDHFYISAGLMETDQKQYFKDLFPVGESLTTYTACRKPEVGTFFELKVEWTGEYTENCGMSFNLFANDCLYHLDFRVNNKGSKNIGVQDFEIKKKWQKIKGSSETLDLKKGSNIVRVYLDPDFYHAFINGANRNEIVDMKEEKLNGAYKNIRLFEMDTGCISIDMEKSFIDWSRVECTNAGNCPGNFSITIHNIYCNNTFYAK